MTPNFTQADLLAFAVLELRQLLSLAKATPNVQMPGQVGTQEPV